MGKGHRNRRRRRAAQRHELAQPVGQTTSPLRRIANWLILMLTVLGSLVAIYLAREPDLVVEDVASAFKPPFIGRENRQVGDSIMAMLGTSILIKNRSWRGGGYVRDVEFVPQSLSGALHPRVRLVELDRRQFGPYEARRVAFRALMAVPVEAAGIPVPLQAARDSIRVEIRLVDQAGAHLITADGDTVYHPEFVAFLRTHYP